MRALITGHKGTVGQALSQALQAAGHTVIGWERNEISPLDFAAQPAFLDRVAPEVIFHLAVPSVATGIAQEGWRITVEWSEFLAAEAARRGVPLVFSSTAMVFNNAALGPFTVNSEPNAAEGYGFEKRMAEQRVMAAHPAARIVRLGWQIGPMPVGNNMLAAASRQMAEQGCIYASRRWLPATSFLTDTAEALIQVLSLPPGVYMADSNRHHSYYAILHALSAHYHLGWRVLPTEDFIYDQRMQDPRLVLPDLQRRLPELG